MASITNTSISMGRDNVQLNIPNQNPIELTRVSTYPKIVGIFLRFLGYATELRTQTGSVYVNINSLISHLFVSEGFTKDKVLKIDYLKGFLDETFREQHLSHSIDAKQAIHLYEEIQVLKDNKHVAPLFNDLVSQQVLECPIYDGQLAGHYTGQLVNHKQDGFGIFTWKGMLIDRHYRYEGNYVDGKREGRFNCFKGKPFYTSYKIVASNEYVNGQLHGESLEKLSGSKIAKSTYVNGKRHGLCFIYKTKGVNKGQLSRVEQYVHGKCTRDYWDQPLETLFPDDATLDIDAFEQQNIHTTTLQN